MCTKVRSEYWGITWVYVCRWDSSIEAILKEIRVYVDYISLAPVVGFFEHGGEFPGFIEDSKLVEIIERQILGNVLHHVTL
jgi:hypothetical protein